jgi:hypothetical protein
VNDWDVLGLKPPRRPRSFGRYRLSYRTEKLEFGNCGKHEWVIAFLLSKATLSGGMVIQKVTYKKWDITNCKTGQKNPGPVENFNRNSFFEAFPVLKGSAESWKDSWGLDEGDCTKGEIEIRGVAKFYDKMDQWMDLPGDFYKNPEVGPNSQFPTSVDRTFFPGGSDSNESTRTLKASWDCCGGSSDKKTEIEVE